MPEGDRYLLTLPALVAFAARAGIQVRRHAVRREVALLARVVDHDAPIIAAASDDKRWVIFRLRLPLRVAAPPAPLPGPFFWTHEAPRAAATLRAALPIPDVLYSDGALGAVLTSLRDVADREARRLASPASTRG